MKTAETYQEFKTLRGAFNVAPLPSSIRAPNTFALNSRFNQPDNPLETFKFLFEKFKKGIYIQIKDARLRLFLPFDNKYYVNDWSTKVDLTAAPSGMNVQAPNHWYANNYLMRFEKPFNKSERGQAELYDLFHTLCQTYTVPDVEFFINRRDFPLLTEDDTEAYTAIHGHDDHCSQPARPSLLLSMVSAPNHCDIPIPPPEDWERATGKTFAATKRAKNSTFVDNFNADWGAKKNCAVFRGSNTGANFGELRTRLCQQVANDARFNAKITSISDRLQFVDGVLCAPPTVDKHLLGSFLSLSEQAQYKYIIHVAGHVQSYRLSAELATYSTILYVESTTKLWYEDKLIPWQHYVPVAADLSDLGEKMDWCQAHEKECEQIAHNARVFYDTTLTKQGCLEYVYSLIVNYRQQMLPLGYAPQPYSAVQRAEIAVLDAWRRPVNVPSSAVRARCYLNIVAPKPQLPNARMTKLTIHEAAVGVSCINPLVEEIPNFIYTFDRTHVEFISSSITLASYIRSQSFRFVSFLNILKQLALSLSHAQMRCFFVHNRATPSNILLYQTALQHFDYIALLDIDGKTNVWRCETEAVIPIWINYKHASAISGGGVAATFYIEPKPAFKPFLDCLWLLVKSAADIIKYHAEYVHLIRDLFNIVFGATDKIFYSSDCEFREFIGRVSSDEYLLNADLGNAVFQNPMLLFATIKDERFSRVHGVEYTHFGQVEKAHPPNEKIPLLQRYFLQRLAKMAKDSSNLTLEKSDLTKGWIIKTRSFEGKILHPKYHAPLNLIISMLTDGSCFALSEAEKGALYAKAREALELGHTLW